MGRPQEFDKREVLEKAMALFWERGYTATSIQDLTTHTGLSKASLYNAFESKDGFFRAVIEHYIETRQKRRLERLKEASPGYDAIDTFFHELVQAKTERDRRLGCLLTNTAVELGPHVSYVEDRLSRAFNNVEDVFRQALQKGIEDGSISDEADIETLAGALSTAIQGIRVLARCGTDEASLQKTAETYLTLIPRP
ncbi:TetR/AcrR family transcriptional regulator [Coralliovum pocilloporae]|uniref:TetR/AcrR family transcriptional regulator n=1 Tax=Coralliovum pocilloporae TaxID=3066369 RepID=UPI003306CD69